MLVVGNALTGGATASLSAVEFDDSDVAVAIEESVDADGVFAAPAAVSIAYSLAEVAVETAAAFVVVASSA